MVPGQPMPGRMMPGPPPAGPPPGGMPPMMPPRHPGAPNGMCESTPPPSSPQCLSPSGSGSVSVLHTSSFSSKMQQRFLRPLFTPQTTGGEFIKQQMIEGIQTWLQPNSVWLQVLPPRLHSSTMFKPAVTTDHKTNPNRIKISFDRNHHRCLTGFSEFIQLLSTEEPQKTEPTNMLESWISVV